MDSYDDDIPAPKKRAIESSLDTDQVEALLVSEVTLMIPVLDRCLTFLILKAPPIPVILSKQILSFVLINGIFSMYVKELLISWY